MIVNKQSINASFDTNTHPFIKKKDRKKSFFFWKELIIRIRIMEGGIRGVVKKDYCCLFAPDYCAFSYFSFVLLLFLPSSSFVSIPFAICFYLFSR